MGISSSILEASFEDYGHLLTFCWIKILWEHLWKSNLLLCNSEQVLPPKLQREGDLFIMERLILLGGLTADQEIRFNCCRLSYQAMTLADIMMGDGSKVTKHALEVSRLSRASSKWDWPNERPCNRDIRCWCKGLCLITSENWGLPFSMHLGRWIHPAISSQLAMVLLMSGPLLVSLGK
jgi:hypothetical protein